MTNKFKTIHVNNVTVVRWSTVFFKFDMLHRNDVVNRVENHEYQRSNGAGFRCNLAYLS